MLAHAHRFPSPPRHLSAKRPWSPARHPTCCFALRLCPSTRSLGLVLDLRGEVIADVPELGDAVFDHQGHVGREGEDDGVGERGGFGEEVEVPQREVEADRLVHLHLDPVLVLGVHVLVWLNDHVARAHLSRHRELDPLLGDSDGDGVAQDGQVAADALELLGRHLDRALVVGVRDPQVLRVDVHELELKVRDAVGVLVLEHEVHRVAVLVRLESHDVVIVAALEYLAHGAEVDAQRHIAVTPEVVEAVRAQKQGHK
mmetsp:Transcript_24124/g.75398  ORF Transcript_24124/g.75398 Transcript_24124/m.75398 type:complete len:257 (+) Transcript_24124:462-1232(+)